MDELALGQHVTRGQPTCHFYSFFSYFFFSQTFINSIFCSVNDDNNSKKHEAIMCNSTNGEIHRIIIRIIIIIVINIKSKCFMYKSEVNILVKMDTYLLDKLNTVDSSSSLCKMKTYNCKWIARWSIACHRWALGTEMNRKKWERETFF